RRRSPQTDERARSYEVTLQGAILGLLGLLLGFTFAMAVSRFDNRKRLVVDEATALGSAFLRARLLPEPEQSEVTKLLRQYLDARMELTRGNPAASSREELTERAARLQGLLWAQAVRATEQDRQAVATGLFVQSLNDVIDMAGKRDAALANHVPESVLLLL